MGCIGAMELASHARYGDWMQTATGSRFYPLDPRPEELCPVDITLALSKMCRFGGHCLRFYSVAEHSIHVSRVLPPHLRLAGLLHDATEAYVNDIIRPIKPWLQGYAEVEHRVWLAVCARWGLDVELDALVKQADNAVLLAEREAIMHPTGEEWSIPGPAAQVSIQCWSPAVAAQLFIAELQSLTGESIPEEKLSFLRAA